MSYLYVTAVHAIDYVLSLCYGCPRYRLCLISVLRLSTLQTRSYLCVTALHAIDYVLPLCYGSPRYILCLTSMLRLATL